MRRATTNQPAHRDAQLLARAAILGVRIGTQTARVLRRGGFAEAVRYLVGCAPTDERLALEAALHRLLTADELYADRRLRVLDQISEIHGRLETHGARQSADPRNYGFVGDLGSLVERLDEAIATIGGK